LLAAHRKSPRRFPKRRNHDQASQSREFFSSLLALVYETRDQLSRL
jgi:hypothetical protein